MCWPKGYSNADWAARRIHWILQLLVWMGQPSDGLPLQNKKKWSLRSQMTSGQWSVEHPVLGDYVKNLFASTAYQVRFDNKISVKAMDKYTRSLPS